MNHKWIKVDNPTKVKEARAYRCETCDAGPVILIGMENKSSLRRKAKQAGIDMNCKVQISKDIMNS